MKILRLLPLLLLVTIVQSRAGDASKDANETATLDSSPFRAGAHEVELRGGSMFSFGNKGAKRPEMDYAVASVRMGWMLNDVKYSGFFRGNWEFLLEAFGADLFRGPGNYMAGSQAMFRFNFVQPGAKIVPYAEFGGGGLFNDIYHTQSQHRIGGGFEFSLHGGLGARWMINDHWALSLEADYQHVSNAGLYSRNAGLNTLGSTLGLNWFF